MRTLRNVTSPKQSQAERRRSWYSYYAGYTEPFVEETLAAYADETGSLLDPWNGSGTTTTVAAREGWKSAGVDINPALTVVARARLTPCSVSDSLAPLGVELLEGARSGKLGERDLEDDLLHVWMRPSAASRVRAIESAIMGALTDPSDVAGDSGFIAFADSLPILACFYYTALFAAARDLLMRFRASNPTWMMTPKKAKSRVAPSWDTLGEHFNARVASFAKRLSIDDAGSNETQPSIHTGSASELPFDSDDFDVCVTSPPYATRIDYVKSVMPELAILGATSEEIETLRKVSTGTPVVAGRSKSEKLRSVTGRTLVRQIRKHKSKGSKGYYAPWMSNYLASLQCGLLEIDRVVSPSGAICVVVQDSYYKELHVDLQRIVTDVLESEGRRLADRRDYEVTHNKARMNPRARRHLSRRTNSESLLVFS